MAVFRVNKTKDYTVMSNQHLKDKNLSLKAIGLLSRILSLPDDWDYSINGLVAICKEEQRAVTAALDELKQYGYLVVRKVPPLKGNNKFSYVYDIYENPQNVGLQNVRLQNVGVQVEGLQNVGANIIRNPSNTKEQKTERRNTERDRRFSPPTFEEVKAYCEERNNSVDAQHFIDYYTSKGWTVGNSPMKDWKAAVRTWERNGVNKNERGRADTNRGVTSPSHRTANGGNYV